MKYKIPKKCLTCALAEVTDDDTLVCNVAFFNDNLSKPVEVEDDYSCDRYELSTEVLEDAKQGCWGDT